MTFVDPQLVAFTVVATIVTVIPGVDMALVARSVLTRGRCAGYVTSVGTLELGLRGGFAASCPPLAS